MVENAGTSAQRIRIGLTGLAAAFIIVLFASAISRSGDDSPVNGVQAASQNSQPNEPLAELGVAPGAPQQSNNSADGQ